MSFFDFIASNFYGIYVDFTTFLVIIFLGLLVGKLVQLLLYRLFVEIDVDKNISKVTNYKISFTRSVSDFVAFCIYLVGFGFALFSIGVFDFVLKLVLYSLAVMLVGWFLLKLYFFICLIYY